MASKETLLDMGTIWNRIVTAKAQEQEPNKEDVRKLTEILAKNPDLLERFLQSQNGNRQEPK